MMRSIQSLICLLVLMFLPVTSTLAQLKLPSCFAEHMVLQRDRDVKIWGWAEPGQTVTVTLGESKTTATADAETGKWTATLPAMKAGGPFRLTVGTDPAKPEIAFEDILVGEVWLCSGQSNMQWTVAASANAQEEIAAAKYPQIRQLGVPRVQANTPQNDVDAKWQVCSPETAGNFTAVGYYFGRKLHLELNVPIGIINSSWGGTRVEPWTPPVGFEMVPALKNIYQDVMLHTPGTEQHRKLLSSQIDKTQQWLNEARQSLETDQLPPRSPAFPDKLLPNASHQSPTKLYNAMIHPLVGYPLRGAIWYQGESNHTEGMLYFEKKKALINGWRKLWGQGDFPFYFVQIAPFQYGNEDPTVLPTFWEAQEKVTELPNTGMVVISDIGNLKDIHPRNKQDVGARLAAFALKNDYGQDVIAGGPVFEEMKTEGESLVVSFSNVGQGLKSSDGQPLTHFEIAGAGTGFQPATATIEGNNQIVLTSDKVDQPLAMRFAWHKLAEPNLVNSAGVPASAFRAGELPSPLDQVAGIEQFELVYELDFSKLGDNFAYQVDRHQSIGKFDRVGYYLELARGTADPQYVFVSFQPFTEDASKIAVPRFEADCQFQQRVGNMQVESNVPGVKTGTNIPGNIEFWPHNYGPGNGARIPGASGEVFDFGDQPGAPKRGYGSMQVHNTRDRQTVFAFNHWGTNEADLGIGDSTGETRDWTFTGSINQYDSKRMKIFVRPVGAK